MKACGLIVEYNPLHNGHVHHIEEAKRISKAECIIAVMSGSFLQRGEPAIIDKFHRTKAALASGVDIVLELPYPYAVQSSPLFAKGSIRTLHEIGISSICFGSESGNINNFITSYHTFKENESIYTETLKDNLKLGLSFPNASELAHEKIGLTTAHMDLSQPNNILGFSYVSEILKNNLQITPYTIKRTNNAFHDQKITSSIASATSIRKELLLNDMVSTEITKTMPQESIKQLELYKSNATTWHMWEHYFPLIHYRVMTMTLKELEAIHGVDEGLEHRIKQTARDATSFSGWITAIKTKRYTLTRLQRMFVHILTNTKKVDMQLILNTESVPYIRLLGLTKTGQEYLNNKKKEITIPIITQLSRDPHQMLVMEERASNAYYSMLPPLQKTQLRKQEIQPPIFA